MDPHQGGVPRHPWKSAGLGREETEILSCRLCQSEGSFWGSRSRSAQFRGTQSKIVQYMGAVYKGVSLGGAQYSVIFLENGGCPVIPSPTE